MRPLLNRLPLMVRALVLVPLLAVGLDQARVSFVCGPDAQSCLDAASSGTLGTAGTLLVIGYMVGIAALVGRMARGRSSLWLVATAGLWAACGGQAVLASALGTGALLGGGWVPLLAFGAAGGALLALALRTARHAFPLPRVPRLTMIVEEIVHQGDRLVVPPHLRAARLTRDRGPPLFA